jgi:hypothetical protein
MLLEIYRCGPLENQTVGYIGKSLPKKRNNPISTQMTPGNHPTTWLLAGLSVQWLL